MFRQTKMAEAFVMVTRFPYEEPYHTHVKIAASNGVFAGEVDFYCGVDELLKIGRVLCAFPTKVPDDYRYEYGSEDRAKRFYRFFQLRVYTTDIAGHCALQFVMNLNEDEPEEGRSCFSIPVEPNDLSRLGELFTMVHRDSTGAFRWTPANGGRASQV